MEAFVGEIRFTAFAWAPRYWLVCDGSILPLVQNVALYSLLGTTYGGNGSTTFQIPNLIDRFPMHRSSTYPLGSTSGSNQLTSGNEIQGTMTLGPTPLISPRALGFQPIICIAGVYPPRS